MKMSVLLEKPPASTQNPVLDPSRFFGHCKRRLRNIGASEKEFSGLLAFYREEGYLAPVCVVKGLHYYSCFQTYTLHLLEEFRSSTLKPCRRKTLNGKTLLAPASNWQDVLRMKGDLLRERIHRFDRLLSFLLGVQDYYLPETRADERFGQWRDYHGLMVNQCSIPLSQIREWRKQLLREGKYKPSEILSDSGLEASTIENWTKEMACVLMNLDPLADWHLFLRYFRYDKKEKLHGSALLAQDIWEISHILLHFLSDLGHGLEKRGIRDVLDWLDLSGRDQTSKLPCWQEQHYGKDCLGKPFEMLEYLANEYGVNPKPRAIIFTEGEEWKAVRKLFLFYQLDPELLGIEFRSIAGEGNFSLSNWQCFVEYMHEKQVLVYFLLDNEGGVAKQAKKLLEAKRKFRFPGLTMVIPRKGRIVIWGGRRKERKKGSASFEEMNFSDYEIATAIGRQTDKQITSAHVKEIRENPSRKKGLIEAIKEAHGIRGLNKGKLATDLVESLIRRREAKPDVKSRTRLENFVIKSGKTILFNHQATGKGDRAAIFAFGHMG